MDSSPDHISSNNSKNFDGEDLVNSSPFSSPKKNERPEQEVLLQCDILQLKGELEKQKEKVKMLENELKKPHRFSFNSIKHSAKFVSHYTGLPNASVFGMIFNLMKDVDITYVKKWKVKVLSKEDQLFLTLMKLKRNLSNLDLGLRFGISEETVSNIFVTWVHALHAVLCDRLLSGIPSRHKNEKSLPKSLDEFTSCRINLDCTEIFAKNPKNMKKQNAMFSAYKHHITLKALVGVAPNGVVTYASKLYPGATSDKSIVADCGVLKELTDGDLVLADKGFLIGDLLPKGVSLNIPPFRTTPQFTEAQVHKTLSIAQARIHVERAIQRIKTFRILDLVPGKVVPYSSVIFQLCSARTSFKPPLLKEIASTM